MAATVEEVCSEVNGSFYFREKIIEQYFAHMATFQQSHSSCRKNSLCTKENRQQQFVEGNPRPKVQVTPLYTPEQDEIQEEDKQNSNRRWTLNRNFYRVRS